MLRCPGSPGFRDHLISIKKVLTTGSAGYAAPWVASDAQCRARGMTRSTGTHAATAHVNVNVPDESTEVTLGDPSTGTGGVDGGQLGTDGVVLKLLLPERETGHVIG